ERLRALPEVESAGVSIAELLAGGSWNQQITVDAGGRFVTERSVNCNAISAGFLSTIGVRVTQGRDFTDRDSRDPSVARPLGGGGSPFRSAIVNESFVRRYLGTKNPIGARIGLGNEPGTVTTIEIVGVVPTFAYRGLRQTDDQAFFPAFESTLPGGSFW